MVEAIIRASNTSGLRAIQVEAERDLARICAPLAAAIVKVKQTRHHHHHHHNNKNRL
jgi:hypothetical protein